MNNKFRFSFFGLLIASVSLVSSCKKNNDPLPELPSEVVKGVFILNEGFGPDASEISYFDLTSSKMTNDFFVNANPDKKLGSGANDMGIYGSKLYVTVDRSNKVEILNANSGKVVKTIDITSPRFVAFHGKNAFVTSYTDQVFVIDTATYAVSTIAVGRTPEQLAVSGDKIYVANSGWQEHDFNNGEYDHTVSVIDANSLTVVNTIPVAKNINKIYADNHGHIYVNTESIYKADYSALIAPSRLYVIDAVTSEVKHKFDFGAAHMAIYEGGAALFTKDQEDGETRFLIMNTANLELREIERFENAAYVYGLGVDPKTGSIWIADAGDYVSPGKVYYHNTSTKVTETYIAGVIPSKFVFKY